MSRPSARAVAAVQAGYYLPSSAAPFLSRRGFESVTGPKREWWLVLTVGWLVGVIGAVLAAGAARRTARSPELSALGLGTVARLGAVDIVFLSRRRISPVYLLDAAAQFALAGAWLATRGPAPSRLAGPSGEAAAPRCRAPGEPPPTVASQGAC